MPERGVYGTVTVALVEVVVRRRVLLFVVLVFAVVVEEVASARVARGTTAAAAASSVGSVGGHDSVVEYVLDGDLNRVRLIQVALDELDRYVGKHLANLLGLRGEKERYKLTE